MTQELKPYLPPEMYVWVVSQDGEDRIRKWDIKPFDEATHICAQPRTPEPAHVDGVHLNHCHQGEYEDTCKYGDKDCPAAPQAPNDDVKATSMQRLEVGKDQWGAPLFVMGTPNAIYALKSKDDLLEQCVGALRRYRNETPLGHQPHMIADDADKLIAAYDLTKGE